MDWCLKWVFWTVAVTCLTPFSPGVENTSQVVTIQNLLAILPQENYASLKYLIQFLAEVSLKKEMYCPYWYYIV